MKIPFFSNKKKQRVTDLERLSNNINITLRTFESKMLTVQTAFETLRQQNMEIIELLQNCKIIESLKELNGKEIKNG